MPFFAGFQYPNKLFFKNKPRHRPKKILSSASSSSDELFIIFDFSCGRFYTHHSSYLKDYSDFLVARNKQTCVWVNTSADKQVLDIFPGNIKPILRSNLYSHTSKDNFVLYFIDYFVNLSERFKTSSIAKFLLRKYYLRSAIKEFKTHLPKHSSINIIAPTLDGLGLRFVEEILKRYHKNISLVSLRVTGAERRSVFGVPNSLELLKKLIHLYPSKIHLGFEVKALEAIMRSRGIPGKAIFWAPMPHVARSKQVSTNKSAPAVPEIRLGFLGSGRPNKGFDNIPGILDELKEKKVNFKAFVQLPKFKWSEFETTLSKLNERHSKAVIFLESGTSKLVLDQTIADMDLIVLPYRLENYKIAGSGILFLASDFGVPVAATKNLAFTWDIDQYQLGFSFIDAAEFGQRILSLKHSNYDSKINVYNEARNNANTKFLGINTCSN